MDQVSAEATGKLPKIVTLINTFSELIGRTISWLTLFMVLVTFVVVVLRYLFNIGWIAMQESIIYMHGLVFMLGAAYTLKNEGHVRVDILYRAKSARFRAWVDFLGTLLLLLPVCLFITWISWAYVAASWSVMETSQEAGGIPAVFLLKSVIMVMATFLVLQGIANLITNYCYLTGRLPLPSDETNAGGLPS